MASIRYSSTSSNTFDFAKGCGLQSSRLKSQQGLDSLDLASAFFSMQSINGFLPLNCLADYECAPAIVNTYIVYRRRVHDRILMDDAFAGWYTNSDIHAINRCRLYRQVECLSDICTADGLSVDRTPNATTYCHFTDFDQVAMSRASQLTLVGSIAPLPQPVYTCFVDQPTTSSPRPMDVRDQL
jgi:hypothetical protein